ncbi:MAG: dienelactone hydrolase family protein [Polaromonas sp.]|nr:dienelactone hydrolase family protein [Polaromonas sp.]
MKMIDLSKTGTPIRVREFTLQVAGQPVPTRVWSSNMGASPAPLVLVGHGGSGHKASQLVIDIAEPLVKNHGFVVAAIDGPVHGARRAIFDDGVAVRQEFRDLWATGKSIDGMVNDWQAVIDFLGRLPEVNAEAVGWYGISMGTAYGLPLVAANPKIKAAVLGMWGTSRVASERLVIDAAHIHCPVLFQQKADDELFTSQGQSELFDAIASRNKTHRIYPGLHTDPKDEQLRDIEAFLVQHLSHL